MTRPLLFFPVFSVLAAGWARRLRQQLSGRGFSKVAPINENGFILGKNCFIRGVGNRQKTRNGQNQPKKNDYVSMTSHA
jgi:hypothetical protein